jgi:hypothetical protein
METCWKHAGDAEVYRMTKPILALDVDGPVALMGDPDPSEVFEGTVDEIPLLISRRLPGRLHCLSAAFQIVWASSWGRRASLKIGPLLGLPAGLPYIPFTAARRAGVSYKLAGLKRYLKSAPAAVVDDEVGPDMWQWAVDRPHTLMLQVDPRHGLVDEHVEQLLEFARRF